MSIFDIIIIIMRFDIITIFPKIFDSYLNESIIKRAQKNKKIKINAINLRDFTKDKHRKVDEKPYGGGAGMVLMAEPLIEAVNHLKKSEKTHLVIFSAKGRQFNQKIAYDWVKKYDKIILISGRYEGIDERVKTILKADEISIGPYVLTDGDMAAMVVISAVSRLIPGVIKLESLEEESHWNLLLKKEAQVPEGKGLEYPHYTRPEIIKYKNKKYPVPKIFLSGDHKKIAAWRKNHQK
ncbi:MAG: tRNA (guanosine(37)-N1)-methyltransferase TrmD [Patescibacteria group bacterium]